MKIIFWGGGDTAREKIYKIKKLSACIEIIAFVDGFIEFSEKDIRWEGVRLISPQMSIWHSSRQNDLITEICVWRADTAC